MPQIHLSNYAFSPQLGWSTTRSETFRTCRRRYFFQYYTRYVPEVPAYHLQRLRNLSSIPMTVGQSVHEVLAAVLNRLVRTSKSIDQARFGRYVSQTIDKQLASSELMEVYYKQRLNPDTDELMKLTFACLEQFLSSDRYTWFQDVLKGDPNYLIEPPGYGEARLQAMKIYAKVDCLLEVNGEIVILDWKTGGQDPAKHLRQLLGYAAWAEHNLQLPTNRICCVAAYLKSPYQEITKQPTRADLQGLAAEVAAEIQQMESLCHDSERNIPLPIEEFGITENLGYCRNCQFRELCDRVDGYQDAAS